MNTTAIMDKAGKRVKAWIASFDDVALHNHAFLVTPNLGSLFEITGREVEEELSRMVQKAEQLPEEVVIKEVSQRWSIKLGTKIIQLQKLINEEG